jgi:hypothetical protein
MQPAGLHWFRRKQRILSRSVLAAFCVTWLQFAAAPCVMALESESGMAAISTDHQATSAASMPDGMLMAPGEHCRYCPSPQPQQGIGQAVCSFPHDPQVDSRASFAAALLAPPPRNVSFIIADAAESVSERVGVLPPAPVPGTPLAVSFCRFLK